MKAERFIIQACCGKKQIIFKTKAPITLDLLSSFKSQGFSEAEHLTKAGVLYVENVDLIVSGPIGSDRLQVKCKKNMDACDKIFNDFEELLSNL